VLESNALLDRQRVRLGNDGDDIDNLSQLLEDDNVNGLQSEKNKYIKTKVSLWILQLFHHK